MNRFLKIYKTELEAGLGEKLAVSNAVLADCNVISLDSPPISSLQISLAERFMLAKAKNTNFDLYPLYTILVSTGWNKNDDIFDRWEVYEAKDTPEDKPFNLEHQPDHVIGHITGGWVVDDKLDLVNDVKSVEDLPSRLHLLTSAVIYKHIASRNKEVEEKTQELIESIAKNEWFVSMEALFSNFDYGVIFTDGSQKVVARNEETAFLTKYLRIFGGEGVYEGKRIGRLLRNITFSGKGLTKKPANPASVIFNDTNIFNGVFATAADIKQSNSVLESEIMAEDNEKVLKMERQYADAQNEIKSLRDRLQKMDEDKVTAEITSLKEVIAQKDVTITERDKKIDEMTASYNEISKKHEELVTAKSTLDKEFAAANEKLHEVEVKASRANRVSVLVDKGVDKAEAEILVDRAGTMTDEQFQLLADATAKAIKPETLPANTETVAVSDEESTTAEEAAADTDLTQVTSEVTPDMTTGSTSETPEVVAELTSYLSSIINKK